MRNKLKRLLKGNKATIGSWLTLAHPAIAEIMAKSGFDWIVIDMEHTTIEVKDIEYLAPMIEANGVVPLVRLPSNDPVLAKRVMDVGAYGVVIPMINTKEEAIMAVQAIKYPPEGKRGVGLYRAQEFGSKFAEYKNTINQESIVIVQIEHKEGVENIAEIVKVKGVDGVFIGPYDLSCSLGVSGQLEHPIVQKAREEILRSAKKAKIACGIHVVQSTSEEVRERIKQGFNFIAYSTDAIVLNTHFRETVKKLKD